MSDWRHWIRDLHKLAEIQWLGSFLTHSKWNTNKEKGCWWKHLKGFVGWWLGDKRQKQKERCCEVNSWSLDRDSCTFIFWRSWLASVRRNEASKWCPFRCKTWTKGVAGSFGQGCWCCDIRCIRCKTCLRICGTISEESKNVPILKNNLWKI